MKPIQWVMLGAAMANTKVLSQIKPERFSGAAKAALEAMKAKKAVPEKTIVDGVEIVSCPPIDNLLHEFDNQAKMEDGDNALQSVVRVWDTLGSQEHKAQVVAKLEALLQRVRLSEKISTHEQHKAELAVLADELAKLAKE